MQLYIAVLNYLRDCWFKEWQLYLFHTRSSAVWNTDDPLMEKRVRTIAGNILCNQVTRFLTRPLKSSLVSDIANQSWSGRLLALRSYRVRKCVDHAYFINAALLYIIVELTELAIVLMRPVDIANNRPWWLAVFSLSWNVKGPGLVSISQQINKVYDRPNFRLDTRPPTEYSLDRRDSSVRDGSPGRNFSQVWSTTCLASR